MKKGSITKFRLDPKKPPKSDWRVFDAMSAKERHRAALSDSDSPPATKAQLARARRGKLFGGGATGGAADFESAG
jgi:hypothetical protein